MKTKYYILIFLLIGIIVGAIWGMNYTPTCSVDEVTGMMNECMGDPAVYRNTGIFFGSIVGIIIGAIVGIIVNRKSK